MKLSKKFIIISIIIIAVLGIIVYGLFIKKNGEEFVLEKVVKGTVITKVSETGMVKASEEAGLSFKNTGRIEKIYVNVGDAVGFGQTLVKLDTFELDIQLREVKAGFEVTEAKRTDAQVSLNNAKQSLKDIEADAEEDLNNAYEDALTILDDAYLKLYNAYNIIVSVRRDNFMSKDRQGVIVTEKRDATKNALDAVELYIDIIKSGLRDDIDAALLATKESLSKTKNSLEIIRDITETVAYRDVVSSANKTLLDNHKSYINAVYINIIDAKQTISTTKVVNETNINSAKAKISLLENQLKQNGLYQAQINQSQAGIQILENKIREAVLRSPANGQITKIEKRTGETVQAVETVISFLPSAPFKIEVDIYEEDIVDVKIGDLVEINLVAFPDEVFEGSVVSVDPAEKLIDGVVYYEVNIDIAEVKKGTKIGMTADIVIETNKKDNILIILKEAIDELNGKRVVEIFKNGIIEKREIKIGLEGDEFVEVVSGLEQGEEIIIR